MVMCPLLEAGATSQTVSCRLLELGELANRGMQLAQAVIMQRQDFEALDHVDVFSAVIGPGFTWDSRIVLSGTAKLALSALANVGLAEQLDGVDDFNADVAAEALEAVADSRRQKSPKAPRPTSSADGI